MSQDTISKESWTTAAVLMSKLDRDEVAALALTHARQSKLRNPYKYFTQKGSGPWTPSKLKLKNEAWERVAHVQVIRKAGVKLFFEKNKINLKEAEIVKVPVSETSVMDLVKKAEEKLPENFTATGFNIIVHQSTERFVVPKIIVVGELKGEDDPVYVYRALVVDRDNFISDLLGTSDDAEKEEESSVEAESGDDDDDLIDFF